MNQEQMNVAKNEMIGWLTHPAELGKAPTIIECAGEFDLHEMHYYIFKYKKELFGKWLLGVAGGYEDESLENCGHTYSEMQEYSAASAQKDAVVLVEHVRALIIEHARKAEERKQSPGTFVNFVLMKNDTWDKEQLIKLLREEWNIVDETPEEEKKDENQDIYVFNYKGNIGAVSMMPAPVPNGEAEYYAQNNYRWREAVEITRNHTAHLVVSVLGKGGGIQEVSQFFVKLVATCCKLEGTLGVFANETVYQPEFYEACAQLMKDNMFPLMNLVWFALYGGKNGGVSAYTCGMSKLGYDEIEILDSKATMGEVVDFLLNICSYVVLENVILKDGETIGFTEEQKLPIRRNKGIAVDGESLKIEF